MSEFEKMVSFIKAAWPARAFIVPCLEGPPGIGKTAAIRQAAAELDGATGKVVTIIASQILPNEVSGITMPVPETKAMEIFDHYRLSSLKDGDVLFFDELLEADQLVLSACLTLIESRQLMSGRQLPDIMIVAATNPTIKPSMLKANIRQRFMWRTFGIDHDGCRQYIKSITGLDVGALVNEIESDSANYNILTQRSLTKLALWINLAESEEEAEEIAATISATWKSDIGDALLHIWKRAHNETDKAKLAKALRKACLRADVEFTPDLACALRPDVFENTPLSEVMEILQALPEWSEVERQLSEMEVESA